MFKLKQLNKYMYMHKISSLNILKWFFSKMMKIWGGDSKLQISNI